MPQTVNAGLTLPTNVVNGGTIQALDVATLYNTLNALSIPDAVAALFQSVYSTSAATTLTGGTSTAAVTSDVALAAVPNTKPLFFLGSYSWATTGVALQLQYRINSTGFALPSAITTSTSGSGLFFIVIGPHDATQAFPVLGWQTGSTGNLVSFTANVALPNAPSTSLGIAALFGTSTNGSTGSTVTWQYAEVWRRT